MSDELDVHATLSDPPGVASSPTVPNLPSGYAYRVTRYADVILQQAFPDRFSELADVLSTYRIDVAEVLTGGGNRAPFVARFDASLEGKGWGKRSITIAKTIDSRQLHSTRGHEIDMFGIGSNTNPYPGVAVEMEWNNKDPFFDRDLLNFQALHREGALAVGIIVTRGPELQRIMGPTVRATARSVKYGQSTTHWNKLLPRVNLGGGGECPLFLIGIEPARVSGFELVEKAYLAGHQLTPLDVPQ